MKVYIVMLINLLSFSHINGSELNASTHSSGSDDTIIANYNKIGETVRTSQPTRPLPSQPTVYRLRPIREPQILSEEEQLREYLSSPTGYACACICCPILCVQSSCTLLDDLATHTDPRRHTAYGSCSSPHDSSYLSIDLRICRNILLCGIPVCFPIER